MMECIGAGGCEEKLTFVLDPSPPPPPALLDLVELTPVSTDVAKKESVNVLAPMKLLFSFSSGANG